MVLTGRLAIHSHRQRVTAVFERAKAVGNDAEMLADSAKYLCVLVSGFIEKSLVEIVLEHARRTGSPSLQRFVEKNTSRFTNANTEKILQLLGSFDADWRHDVESVFDERIRGAFDSVVGLRHQIVHGVSVGLTYVRIKEYFESINEAIDYIQEVCIPDK